ncbi:hypothetical protein SteCoe_15467 [Stentor coeruleus]|uniref:VWFA domain-containing protein n=1 Tax=Stentor coeruleus TaxID=5963 RepID=A0A1R2C3K7_9CILI|nr:hypothetical protein SteCoe_15467 [Stentor coeruleus]
MVRKIYLIFFLLLAVTYSQDEITDSDSTDEISSESDEDELIDQELEILDTDDLSLEEDQELLDVLEELSISLDDDDVVIIDGDELTASELDEEISDLEEDIAQEENIIEAESVIEDGEEVTSEDLEDLIDELDDLEIDEPIEIDGEVISDDEELEEYIEELEDTAEELEIIEELDEEITEAEALMVDLENADSAELFELAGELQDILDLMDLEDTVLINDVGYTYDALEDYIEDLNEEALNLQHEEELIVATDEAILALGDASTSEQLAAYVVELEELLEIMNEDDVVIIMDREFTEEEIEEEIQSIIEDAQDLKIQEELDEAIEAVEEVEEVDIDELETSEEVGEIIDAYETLISSMEDSDELTIEIDGDDTTTEDLQEEIDELLVIYNDLASQEELDSIAAEIEEYVLQYIYEDGIVYITPEQLSGELSLWKKLQGALDEGEVVIVNGFEYTIDNIDDFIIVIENTIDYLEENNLVQVVVDGVISYMPEDEYSHMLAVDQSVISANEILEKDELTSDDLFELADVLEELLSLMYEDEVVVLDDVEYTYDELEAYADDIKAQAMDLNHEEKVISAAAEVEELLQNNDEWTTKNELEKLVSAWESLLATMEIDDEVEVDSETYNTEDIQEEIAELQDLLDNLDDGEILYTDPNTGETQETIAQVTNSVSLSEQAYYDLITSGSNYNLEIPVISTASSSDVVASKSGEPLELVIIIKEEDTTTSTFLQTTQDEDTNLERDDDEAPEEDAEPEEEYQDGETNFILVTTYIPDEEGTGKVFVFDKENPENFVELVIGLQEPTGVCFDVNHNFLYVADQGGLSDGGIFQYQISWEPEDGIFTLDNTVYVQIYTGTPSDCKVDAYGNLYYTELLTNSIHKVTYADLYNGYANEFTILYIADEETNHIDRPIAIEVFESEDIYFVNNVDGTVSGTLNKAEAELEDTNEEPIFVLVSETSPAWGLAIGEKYAYYSLDSGEVSGYHLDDRTVTRFSTGFFIAPRGLCYGDNKVYVTDNGAGALYKMEEGEDDEPEIVAFIQAVSACFCVNVQDSNGVWIIVGMLFSSYFL